VDWRHWREKPGIGSPDVMQAFTRR
jgi:hypothetical protein